jgi:hypothetical protein
MTPVPQPISPGIPLESPEGATVIGALPDPDTGEVRMNLTRGEWVTFITVFFGAVPTAVLNRRAGHR